MKDISAMHIILAESVGTFAKYLPYFDFPQFPATVSSQAYCTSTIIFHVGIVR